MTNKQFYEKVASMLKDRSLRYAERDLPEFFVRVKVGGHFFATSAEDAGFLSEIRKKVDDNQFFTEPMLNRATGKSASFSSYEVRRGRYALLFAGKFKLYIVKDW